MVGVHEEKKMNTYTQLLTLSAEQHAGGKLHLLRSQLILTLLHDNKAPRT